MPIFLGKEYTSELVFQNAFNTDVVTILTPNMDDVALVGSVTASSFTAMKKLQTKQMKTLVATKSIGTILVTTKA
jgi:hypothetical protein